MKSKSRIDGKLSASRRPVGDFQCRHVCVIKTQTEDRAVMKSKLRIYGKLIVSVKTCGILGYRKVRKTPKTI